MGQHRSRALRTRFLRLFGLPSRWEVEARLDELRYSQLWTLLQQGQQLPLLYPSTLGAANASLLYTLGRILTELPLTGVIEFGAGATSILIGHSAAARGLDAVTIEHDPYWAEHVKQQVAHTVHTCPLTEQTAWEIPMRTYALPEELNHRRFDLLVVDGPPGTPAYSRVGSVAQALSMAKDEFILVMDDVDREGEQQTIRLMEQQLKRDGRTVKFRYVHAAKHQLIVCTPRFEAALYL